MKNPKDRYSVVYPGGLTRNFQTLNEARKERNRFERSQWQNGMVALIYDRIKQDYVE